MSSSMKRWLIVILSILLILSETILDAFKIFKYIDEVLTISLGLFIIFKLRYLKKTYRPLYIIFVLYAILVIIGLSNNLIYKVQPSFVAIAIDAIATVKLIVFVIAAYLLLDINTTALTLKTLSYVGIPFIFVGFVFSIVSLVVDTGMRGQLRFNIYGFNFVFEQAHTYTMVVLFFTIILTFTIKNKVKLYRFYFYAIVQTVLTLKGPSFIWCALLVLFLLYFKKTRKINIFALVIVGLVALSLGTYQIQTYFLDPTAPRAKLLIYGFETLKSFNYFGSGFATYGSYAAAKYYSPLYIEYGFEGSYGMSSYDYQFLMDTYWPMLMGQFGIIGTLIVAFAALYFFRLIQKRKMPYQSKAVLFACYFYLLIHSLGSSSPTISMAALLGVGMVILTRAEEYRILYARYVYERKEEKSTQKVGKPASAI